MFPARLGLPTSPQYPGVTTPVTSYWCIPSLKPSSASLTPRVSTELSSMVPIQALCIRCCGCYGGSSGRCIYRRSGCYGRNAYTTVLGSYCDCADYTLYLSRPVGGQAVVRWTREQRVALYTRRALPREIQPTVAEETPCSLCGLPL